MHCTVSLISSSERRRKNPAAHVAAETSANAESPAAARDRKEFSLSI